MRLLGKFDWMNKTSQKRKNGEQSKSCGKENWIKNYMKMKRQVEDD